MRPGTAAARMERSFAAIVVPRELSSATTHALRELLFITAARPRGQSSSTRFMEPRSRVLDQRIKARVECMQDLSNSTP
ncbi:hypothetical protein BC567DRAFT_238222 [Phyllosticta citribraziliensis]